MILQVPACRTVICQPRKNYSRFVNFRDVLCDWGRKNTPTPFICRFSLLATYYDGGWFSTMVKKYLRIESSSWAMFAFKFGKFQLFLDLQTSHIGSHIFHIWLTSGGITEKPIPMVQGLECKICLKRKKRPCSSGFLRNHIIPFT